MAENKPTSNLLEQWKPISGHEGSYEVSDHGRVRSLEREVTRRDGTKRVYPRRILKPIAVQSGHLQVKLYKNGYCKAPLVHRLVLEAFIGPQPEGKVACHYDDNPENNHVSNLRWDTQSSNMFDKVRNGNHHEARKTHCKRGHEFTPESVYPSKDGKRQCKACKKITAKRYWANRRAKELQEQ